MINVLDDIDCSEEEYENMLREDKIVLLLNHGKWNSKKVREIRKLKEECFESPYEEYQIHYCVYCRLLMPSIEDDIKCKASNEEIINCIKVREYVENNRK